MVPASRIEKQLQTHGLDPRSINSNGVISTSIGTSLKGIFGLILMITMIPLSIMTLPQALLAWWLGNNSDEGLDARSTFHVLAVTFSPIIIWPFFTIPISIFIALNYTPEFVYITSIILSIILIPLLHIGNLIFLLGYDAVCDVQTSFARKKLRRTASQTISEDISLILGFLK